MLLIAHETDLFSSSPHHQLLASLDAATLVQPQPTVDPSETQAVVRWPAIAVSAFIVSVAKSGVFVTVFLK